MSQKARHFCIEGEWTGYHSGQRRVVHREYTTSSKFAEKVAALGWITYTDGTALSLTVKPYRRADNGKKLPAISGYTSLIRDCVFYGTGQVSELSSKRLRNATPSQQGAA